VALAARFARLRFLALVLIADLDRSATNQKGNQSMRKSITTLIASALLVLAIGCQKAPEKPKLSEIFKTQLVQYLKDGGKLSTQSGEGINILTLKSQLTDAKATFDLLDATWPAGFCPGARESFKKSHEGYSLAAELWGDKLNKYDSPMEPNINGWTRYQAFAGDALLVVKIYSGGVDKYEGKKYLPADENVSVLLTLAGAHFDKGRAMVLKELE
jgi:hypothetical protein